MVPGYDLVHPGFLKNRGPDSDVASSVRLQDTT